MRKILNKILFSAILLLSMTVVFGQSEYGFIEGENFENSVVYKTVDGSNVVMDIFFPDAEKMQEKNPWVVFVHGGGWAGGNIDDIYKTAFLGGLQNLVDNGVIVASIGYRLAKVTSVNTTYESAIDCKDAARFLLKNATEYKLDEENYGIWGGSAGGHLALVTALSPDSNFPGDAALSDISPNYKGVLSYYPATSLINPGLNAGSIFEDGTLIERLLGGTLEENLDLANSLSPTEFLDANSLPVLLVHGENDTTLPVINSTYMKEVAVENSANVELISVANAEHSFSGITEEELDVIAIKSANFFLSKFGYEEIEYEEPVVDLTPAFEPELNTAYYAYNPRWDNRLAANGGNELIVLEAIETANTVKWMFTPVDGEEGYYYIDCLGGLDKPRISADGGELSIMVANTYTDDSAKWRFDYYGDDILFHFTNKNERRLRSWGDHVDVLGSNKNGTYMRYSFTEVEESLSLENDILKSKTSVYPMPVSDVLNIDFEIPTTAIITVIDITGKSIISKELIDVSNQLDVSSLISGFYIVKIESNKAKLIKKIIKF